MHGILIPQEARSDVQALAAFVSSVVRDSWYDVLTANADKLADAYARGGDMAYGTYLGLVFRPINRAIRSVGLRLTPELPGNMDRSREWSAAPDETHQQRLMWSFVQQGNGQPIGALVTVVHHDHTGFRLPHDPDVFALAASSDEAVIAQLTERFAEFGAAKEFTVEVAEYLASVSAFEGDASTD